MAGRDDTPLPVDGSLRRLGVAWRRGSNPAVISPVGILCSDGGEYSFRYLRTVEGLVDFRPLLGFPDVRATYRSTKLFPFFAQRVMDRRRPDFPEYLAQLHLPPTASEFDVLARSGGKRKGDTVQVAEEPEVGPEGDVQYDFLLRGARYAPSVDEDPAGRALDRLQTSDLLRLVPEPTNPVNPDALLVLSADGHRVGWVPDLLVYFAAEASQAPGSSLRVLQTNGPDAPLHLRVVARLSGRVSAGYRLLAGPRWQVDAV